VRLQEIVIEVLGMSSPDAERSVAAALGAVPGVRAVRVEANERRAVVTGDPDIAAPEALSEAIRNAGCIAGDVWFAE
jgi:copper chaperone CopZ